MKKVCFVVYIVSLFDKKIKMNSDENVKTGVINLFKMHNYSSLPLIICFSIFFFIL